MTGDAARAAAGPIASASRQTTERRRERKGITGEESGTGRPARAGTPRIGAAARDTRKMPPGPPSTAWRSTARRSPTTWRYADLRAARTVPTLFKRPAAGSSLSRPASARTKQHHHIPLARDPHVAGRAWVAEAN